MTTPLQQKSVYFQPENIPADLHIWQDENSGIAALAQAAQDIANGKKISFALCSQIESQWPTVDEVVTLEMGKGGKVSEGYSPTTPRYCGENDNPNGPGSHALIASWYSYCADPAYIAVALALAFKGHQYYFRLL